MKNKYLIIAAILVATVFLGCFGNSGSLPGKVNFSKNASYALGFSEGAGFRGAMIGGQIYPDIDEFLKGMKDGIMDKGRFSEEEVMNIIDTAFQTLREVQSASAIQDGIKFLEENAKNPGVAVTPSGLQYEVITEGNGPKPTENDTVKVNFEGKLIDGSVFDSSFDAEPYDIGLEWLVPGWSEGLQLMSVGSRYILYVPSEIGYGEQGMTDWSGRPIIPPYATLIIDIELLEINPDMGGY